MAEHSLVNNVDRFSGFEETYDRNRPQAPRLVPELLTSYLGEQPRLVVDIGCGTGLSTFIWKDRAERIVGVEPNDDMRGMAVRKLERLEAGEEGEGAAGKAGGPTDALSFIPGYSHEMPLETGSADIITCSQSFHWMEPVSTLREVSRLLRDGGIFAAYDCDWPPTVHWTVEAAYLRLIDTTVGALVDRLAEEDRKVRKWDKERHLTNLNASGAFRYTKEIVFHNPEPCDAERFIGLAVSQGGLQTVLKLAPRELDSELARFRTEVEGYFAGRTLEILFSYRMRLGVK